MYALHQLRGREAVDYDAVSNDVAPQRRSASKLGLCIRLAEGANATGLARAVHRRRERIVQVWAEQIGAEFELDTSTARLVSASVTSGASALVQRVFTDLLNREMVADRLVELARAQGEAAQEADSRGSGSRSSARASRSSHRTERIAEAGSDVIGERLGTRRRADELGAVG